MSDQVMRVWALPHCGASNIDINKLGTPGKPPNVKIRFWPGTAGQRPLFMVRYRVMSTAWRTLNSVF